MWRSLVVETNDLWTDAASGIGHQSVEVQFLTKQIDRRWADEVAGNFLPWGNIGESCSKMAVDKCHMDALCKRG